MFICGGQSPRRQSSPDPLSILPSGIIPSSAASAVVPAVAGSAALAAAVKEAAASAAGASS